MVAPSRLKRPILTLLSGLAVACLGLPPAEAARRRTPACAKVQSEIDSYARTLAPERQLERLTPYMSERVMRDLVLHTAAGKDERLFKLFVAIGRTRQGESLRQLTNVPSPSGTYGQVGRAIALLELGDGSQSATIGFGLYEGPIGMRRLVAAELGRMKHKRPLALLYESMRDEDPTVRLYAARGLLLDGSSRARRVLKSLARSAAPRLRRQAARALVDYRVRMGVDMIAALPEPMRSRAVVSEAVRGQYAVRRRLGRDVISPDRNRRSAAFAALAHVETPYKILRMSRAAVKRYGNEAEAEQTMAVVLTGDGDALSDLDRLGPPGIARAIEVLWAFTGAGPDAAQMEPEDASQIAARIDKWIAAGAATGRNASRAMRAMESLDGGEAAVVARNHLQRADGWPLRTAVRVLARHGEVSDVPALIGVATRASKRTRVEAWRSAARICAR